MNSAVTAFVLHVRRGCLASALLLGAGLALSSALFGAAPAASLDEVVRSVQAASGVCVHVGCGDGTLSARFAEKGRLVVHGLEPDANKVKSARQTLLARGLYGLVSLEQWSAPWLPYADDLVNVVVAENPDGVPPAELRRVLAPNGVVWIQRDGAWTSWRKPWPADFDEWTHWRHGADGNMVSQDAAVGVPVGLRWVGGPAQDAGGKRWYYDHFLVSARGRNFYLTEESLAARDAFNGALLWSKPVKAATFREVGADVPEFLKPKTKLGTRLTKVKPVVIADRLYLATTNRLLALDAATGDTVADFGPVKNPRELLLEGSTLVLCESNQVRAFGAASQAALWSAPVTAERIVAGDGTVFCLASNLIVGLDLATGQTRWRTEDAAAAPATTCTFHEGVLVLETPTYRDDGEGCGVQAYSGKDGRLLWAKKYVPDMTHNKEARAFFARGLVWLQMEKNTVVAFDPQTGKQKRSLGSRGKHCASPVATENYFIAPECEFTDLDTGSRTRARMFRGACRLPFIPANGLLNTFPVQCECFPMLRGYMGLTSTETRPGLGATPRLEKGPAYGRLGPVSVAQGSIEEWPIYRHDVWRSGSTPSSLAAGLKEAWSVAVGRAPKTLPENDWSGNPFTPGLVTAPVIAAGKVFVALPDEHRVLALDDRSGAQRWTFVAGGRIDTPPTIQDGLCLFGAHDGWVYCLSADNGEMVWRFRAAPREARIMAYGQMESLWPVPGSVLVDHGVAYLAAGRHPMSDGGLQLVALQARTGALVWEKNIHDLTMTNWYSPLLPNKKKVGLDFEPVDMLVKDGDAVAMSRWQFDPRNGHYKLHLASAEYQTPGLEVPRGLWSYGVRQNKSVETKQPAAFDQTKVHIGTTNDVALVLAGATVVSAARNGELKVGDRSLRLDSPPVHDGLAVANGRLYVSTRNGRLVCFE